MSPAQLVADSHQFAEQLAEPVIAFKVGLGGIERGIGFCVGDGFLSLAFARQVPVRSVTVRVGLMAVASYVGAF